MRKILIAFLFSSLFCTAAPSISQRIRNFPLAFEPVGEGFIARGEGYQISIRDGNVRLAIQSRDHKQPDFISMNFAGGRSVPGVLETELPGKVNDFRTNDRRRWRTGISTYESVRFCGIYDGVDVSFYGSQEHLEFDLILKPGADPGAIRLKFSGMQTISMGEHGEIVLTTRGGELRLPLPVLYQIADKSRTRVAGYYVLKGSEVRFEIENYDRAKPLVIDPSVVYASYLGGATATNFPLAVAVDSSGNAYVTGCTYASDFPQVDAAQTSLRGAADGFVTKINPAGTAIVYSTFLGGISDEYLDSIAVDSTGAAWVTGYTQGPDYPLASPYQGPPSMYYPSAVISELSSSGALVFSTYLHGSGTAFANSTAGAGIAVDASGNAYVVGNAEQGFPVTTGALKSTYSPSDGFITKFSAAGALVYSTYIHNPVAIAADASGNAYITGGAVPGDFANVPAGGAQPTIHGQSDAFIAKINPAGTALVYFTYLGGSGGEGGDSIAVDASGNAYVAGSTNSSDLPVTSGVFQSLAGGNQETGFVAKLNSAGTAFSYVTYLGGNHVDVIQRLAIDGSGNAYVIGNTESSIFPLVSAMEGNPSSTAVSLFQTSDGGNSWIPFDANIPGVVYDLSPDPLSSGVLVAATSTGIARSTDAGNSWSVVYANGLAILSLSRSLGNPSTIYGVSLLTSGWTSSRSVDGGLTWSQGGSIVNFSSGDVKIVADPISANTAYAYSSTIGAYKTTDGGITWAASNTGLPSVSVGVLLAASDGSLYVTGGASQAYGIYKSTDHGASWQFASSSLGQSYIQTLAVAPSNPEVIYASYGQNIYESTDGAATWNIRPGVVPGLYGVTNMAVSSDPTQVFAISSTLPAIYVSTDSATTWTPASTGLGTPKDPKIVLDPLNSAHLFAVATVSPVAFLTKINDSGSAIAYSTYLAGNQIPGNNYINSAAAGLAASASGDAIVVGYTNETGFPVTPDAFQTTGGTNTFAIWHGFNYLEGFVVRVSASTPSCSYSVLPGDQSIDFLPHFLGYSVVAPSGCSWTASSDQTWAAVVAGETGSGSGTVLVNVPQSAGELRTATLTIAGQSFSLTQSGDPCSSYSFSYSVPGGITATGGTITIAVSVDNRCSWTVTNPYPNAISIVSGGSGTGAGTIVLSLAPNNSPNTRQFFLPIGTNGTSFTQPGICDYSIYPTSANLSNAGASGSITVSAPSGCSWTSTSDAAWLTATALQTSLSYNVAPNTTPNSRTGSLTIAGLKFTVTQSGFDTVPTTVLRNSTGSILVSSYASSMLSNSGGLFASDPSAAQDWNGNTFVTARDNFNSIWANVYNPNTSSWSGWQFGGGVIQGVPAIAVDLSGTAWIGSRDTYNSYWLVNYSPGLGFGTWLPLLGVFSTDPVVTSCADGSLYVIGKDNYNSLWSGHYIPGSGFQGWQFGGGIIKGKPAATCGTDNAVYVVAEDNYNSNWMARVSGNTWTGWFFGGAITSVTPRIATLGTGSEAVVILDPTNVVWRTTFTEGTGNGWQPWVQVGGILQDVEPAGAGGQLYFAGKAPNGDLWWWQQSGSQWTWVGNNGVAAGSLSSAPK